MSIFDKVTLDDPRPLPVILLVDTSDSMSEENRIGVCDESIRSMLREFAQLDRTTGAIQIAVITFGGQARIHQPLTPVRQIEWTDMEPSGLTPIGGALRLAGQILEDREQVPTRAYEPTLVLVSDGLPTDDYEDELPDFRGSPPSLAGSPLGRLRQHGRDAPRLPDTAPVRWSEARPDIPRRERLGHRRGIAVGDVVGHGTVEECRPRQRLPDHRGPRLLT